MYSNRRLKWSCKITLAPMLHNYPETQFTATTIYLCLSVFPTERQ